MTSKKPFYITTPIYYVNDTPHIGHTCTTLASDIIHRWQKTRGRASFFLTGTDEHGAKIAESARKAGKSPQEFVDQVAKRFVASWRLLDIEYDYFIRTTDKRHIQLASQFIEKLRQQGDIYKGKYEGLYCVGCEKFVTEKELKNGKCPLHNRPPERQEEENYFFRLKKYLPRVRALIEEDIFQISPSSKKKEILNKIARGVDDLSISRANVRWGIPLPWDETQTIYVWFEALLNYWTAPQIVRRDLWPADIHLIGKEIAWFHCVIWPAMLLAGGEKLPKKVFVHDFYNLQGIKMSKSLGNVVTPQELAERFGSEGARYLLASFFPYANDTALNDRLLVDKYNADLANGLGNLVSRLASLASKNGLGGFSAPSLTPALEGAIAQEMAGCNLPLALEKIFVRLRALDKQLNQTKPWQTEKEQTKPILEEIIARLLQTNLLLKPFLPRTGKKIEEIFGATKIDPLVTPLFPRLR